MGCQREEEEVIRSSQQSVFNVDDAAMQHWRVEDFWDRVFRPTRKGQCVVVFKDTTYALAMQQVEAMINYVAGKPWLPYGGSKTFRTRYSVDVRLLQSEGETKAEVSAQTQEQLTIAILRDVFRYWRDSVRIGRGFVIAVDVSYPIEEKVIAERLTSVDVVVTMLFGLAWHSTINWKYVFPGFPNSFQINPAILGFDLGEMNYPCGMTGGSDYTCTAGLYPADKVLEFATFYLYNPAAQTQPAVYYYKQVVSTGCYDSYTIPYIFLPPGSGGINPCPLSRQDLQTAIDNFHVTIAQVNPGLDFIVVDVASDLTLCACSYLSYANFFFGKMISILKAPDYVF